MRANLKAPQFLKIERYAQSLVHRVCMGDGGSGWWAPESSDNFSGKFKKFMHYSRDRQESNHKPKRTAVGGRMNTYIAGYKSLPVSLQFCAKARSFNHSQGKRLWILTASTNKERHNDNSFEHHSFKPNWKSESKDPLQKWLLLCYSFVRI